MSYKNLFMASATCLLLLGSACAPVQANRGNYLRNEKLALAEPSVATKADITRAFGPPTTVATFDENIWYYIGEQTETMGMFETEVKERRIVALQFDENGVLQDIREIDPAQGQSVEFVDRTTPNAGKEFTVIQQLVGNIGRFTPDSADKGVQTGSQ